jgi:uncharacterized membrane protein YidH (DUF202 family)
VRTAIAVMAFGFLVAKFDLFLKVAARSLPDADHPNVLPRGDFGAAIAPAPALMR